MDPDAHSVRRVDQEAPLDRLEDAYLRTAAPALRLAYFLCGDRELAQDLVQEAFVRAAGRLVHLREIHSIDSYLRRSIVNLFSSSLRRRRIERAWLVRQAEPDAYVAEHDSAERDSMWRALQQLPDRQRGAIVLRYYEDLSEQDAADVLGCSTRALNSLVVRGTDALRTALPRNEEP